MFRYCAFNVIIFSFNIVSFVEVPHQGRRVSVNQPVWTGKSKVHSKIYSHNHADMHTQLLSSLCITYHLHIAFHIKISLIIYLNSGNVDSHLLGKVMEVKFFQGKTAKELVLKQFGAIFSVNMFIYVTGLSNAGKWHVNHVDLNNKHAVSTFVMTNRYLEY